MPLHAYRRHRMIQKVKGWWRKGVEKGEELVRNMSRRREVVLTEERRDSFFD
jgi:hypothetical protein